MPMQDFLKIKVDIPISDIDNNHPKKILNQLYSYINIGDADNANNMATTEINIIHCKGTQSSDLMKILNAVNTYLIRNRSAVSDFNLIKDIVERTGDKVEEEINSTISVPLY